MTTLGALHGLGSPEPWTEAAICPQVGDGDMWFPEGGTHGTAAKKVCLGCPVRAECLEFAIRTEQRYGIYGGFSEHERERLLRGENPLNRPRRSFIPRKASGHPIACKCVLCRSEAVA